jgi:hypothetical protein
MTRSASVAAQRLDVLEAEVARLRQVIEERLVYPVPLHDGVTIPSAAVQTGPQGKPLGIVTKK